VLTIRKDRQHRLLFCSMTETITTKPGDKYRSIKNPCVYEALRREGHDKASAARISNAQAKRRVVRRKSYTLADLEVAALKDHDPLRAAAIAAQLPQTALKGEQLAPGVTRIHGDLCNVHGRWGSCSGAGHSDSKRVPFKALPKTPKPKVGKRAGGRKGRAARAAAKPKKAAQTDAQRQQAQLAREARSEQRYQAHHAQSRAEREADQKKREAAQLARDVARQQERMRREMERQNKPKGGGGGGKGKQPRQPIAARMAQIANRPARAVGGGGAKPAKSAAQKPQLAQELIDAAQLLSDGKPIDQATEDLLVRNGLARRVKGDLVLSATGLRALRRGQKSFAVFKDASGHWRWLSRTTTAFEDRDKEVISTESLADDVQRADENGKYGPLRWWHMGRPDPLNVDAPWGLGVDLGWCDFNAVSGKTLIESGTFKSEVIARAVAAKAKDLELSPGFFHAIGEPDAAGVFHHIRRFERSLVPTWAGRASNYYTGLIVQEKAMDQKKIEALKTLGLDETTLKALIGDVERAEKTAEAEGVRYKEQSVDLLRALLTGEQPAQEAAPAADSPADPLATLKEELVALRAEIATLKALPPPAAGMDAEDDPAQGGDAGADEAAEGEPPIDEGDSGLTLSTDDLAAIGQVIGSVVQGALEPLIGAMGITQKLEGHLGELKTMMGSYVKQKDDSEAQHAQEVAALKASIEQQQAKLAELLGEQPRASYRPTQATDNSPWTDPQVLAAIKDAAAGNGFEDLTSKLFPGILPPN
jgi:hypothetical protein